MERAPQIQGSTGSGEGAPVLSGWAGNLMETRLFPLDCLSPAFSPVIPPSFFEQSFFVCLFVCSFNFLAAPRSMLDLTSLPDQGLYPRPLPQKHRALTPGPSGKSLNKLFYFLECEVEEVSHSHKNRAGPWIPIPYFGERESMTQFGPGFPSWSN